MYNMTQELQMFYDKHVRLGQERRAMLAGFRDANVERIKSGLDDLAEEKGQPHPHPSDIKNQGGYAMHTLNQDPEDDNDYDIDVALVFKKDDLPEDPIAARQRVKDALLKRAANFARDPEARTNAVTVWYAEGYHVDFAIYRQRSSFFEGDIIEHASTEWTRRNPSAFTEWFFKQVDNKSPKAGFLYEPNVPKGQMRRIVRFLKWYCRSRTSWCLPGGMAMSILVNEVYRPNADRDDQSLYETLVALRDRLENTVKVFNPVESSQELTARPDVQKQVVRLRDNLRKHIPRLDPLFDSHCTYYEAHCAWDWIFNHEFWSEKPKQVEVLKSILPNVVKIKCGLATAKGWPTYKDYPSGAFVLPKGIALKFSIASTDVTPPYVVRWKCQNEGDEAADAGQLAWEKINDVCWTSTKYKGRQKMTCEIEKGDAVRARQSHTVKIAEDGWGNPE